MSYVVMHGWPDPGKLIQDIKSGNLDQFGRDLTGGGGGGGQTSNPAPPAAGFMDQKLFGLPLPLVAAGGVAALYFLVLAPKKK